MLFIPGRNLQLRQDGRLAALSVGDAAVIDEPTFPKVGPVYSASEDYNVTWESAGSLMTLEDRNKYFLINGYPAQASAEFAVEIPELNFSFSGKAASTFAFIGAEVNGYYYMQREQPPEKMA